MYILYIHTYIIHVIHTCKGHTRGRPSSAGRMHKHIHTPHTHTHALTHTHTHTHTHIYYTFILYMYTRGLPAACRVVQYIYI